MSEPIYLKTTCGSCGGHIEYPETSAGQTFACPHCSKDVLLQTSTPPIPKPETDAPAPLTESQIKELNNRTKRDESRLGSKSKKNVISEAWRNFFRVKGLKDLHLLSDAGVALAISAAILLGGLVFAGLIYLAVYAVKISPETKQQIYSWGISALEFLALLALALRIYFHPTIVASKRKHVNLQAIFVLNLLLGWTFLFWVLSLVWAYKVKE